MNSQDAPMNPTPNSKVTSALTRVMTGLSVLLGAMWALITYVFPDPSVFGFGFVNWKNLVLLVSAFSFFGVLSIGWQARRLPESLKGLFQLILASALAAGFFILGGEYAKPSFEFAKAQAKIVENDGANLLGKRVEALDMVRIELLGCENIGQLPSCTVELTNVDIDREFRFATASLFDQTGGVLSLESVHVGQAKGDRWLSFQLIRNVPTRVTLIFQEAHNKLNRTPAIKLLFRGRDSEDHVLKFSDVAMQ